MVETARTPEPTAVGQACRAAVRRAEGLCEPCLAQCRIAWRSDGNSTRLGGLVESWQNRPQCASSSPCGGISATRKGCAIGGLGLDAEGGPKLDADHHLYRRSTASGAPRGCRRGQSVQFSMASSGRRRRPSAPGTAGNHARLSSGRRTPGTLPRWPGATRAQERPGRRRHRRLDGQVTSPAGRGPGRFSEKSNASSTARDDRRCIGCPLATDDLLSRTKPVPVSVSDNAFPNRQSLNGAFRRSDRRPRDPFHALLRLHRV